MLEIEPREEFLSLGEQCRDQTKLQIVEIRAVFSSGETSLLVVNSGERCGALCRIYWKRGPLCCRERPHSSK